MDDVFRWLCFASAALGVLILIGFLIKIFSDGMSRVDWKFIVDDLSSRPKKTGIWPAIVGSFYVMALTFVIAVPVGVAAAIYLEEFNERKNKVTEFIQLNIANLRPAGSSGLRPMVPPGAEHHFGCADDEPLDLADGDNRHPGSPESGAEQLS